MTSQARIDANRRNAEKSSGPRTEAGKARAKMNGLKHGLRAEEVVLPTENREEFTAYLQEWMEDWQPSSETRRFLVERAATAAWKLRRVTRIETSRMKQRFQEALDNWDRSVNEQVETGVRLLAGQTERGLAILQQSREGLKRLLAFWDGLVEALQTDGEWSDLDEHHFRFLQLIGFGIDPTNEVLTDIAHESWRLYLRAFPDEANPGDTPVGEEELTKVVNLIRGVCRKNIEGVLRRLDLMPDRSAERIRYAESQAFEAMDNDATLHRYEARLDREAKSSINQLIKLQQAGADLPEVKDEPPAPTEPNAQAPAEPVKTPAPTEPNPIPAQGLITHADRDRNGRVWEVETPVATADRVDSSR